MNGAITLDTVTRISRRQSGLASIPSEPHHDSGRNPGKIGRIAPGILANSEAQNGSQGNRCVTKWIVVGGSVVLSAVVIVSWLASFRTPKAASVSSSKWFALPAWAQIGAGLAVIVLFVCLGYLMWIPLPLNPSLALSATLRVIGLAVFIAGLSLVLWARWALGAMYGVSTSSAAQLRAQHRLIQHGPYAFVRHPMYLGYWLVLAGTMLMYRTWTPLALLAMCVPSFYRRARREEDALAFAFGDEWRAYTARTKFVIPLVY